MALVFVAKDMQVANPVGHVNINPLPALPSGLSRAHLLRLSLNAMNINLVDGQLTEFEERNLHEHQATFTYDDYSIHSDWGSSGWYDPSWVIPYTAGFTFMAVAALTNDIARLMSSGEYVTSGGGMVNFNIQASYPRLRMGGTDESYVQQGFTAGDQMPVMFFGAIDGSSLTRSVYVPHADAYNEDTFIVGSPPAPSVIEGMIIGAALTPANDAPRDGRFYLVAQWDRTLGQAEMAAAYTALKPWLQARGVVIA